MLLVHPIEELPRALPALIALIAAGSASGHAWWTLGGLALTLAYGLSRWFTTTYRVTEDQVSVRSGLLRRRVRSVNRDRVRTVDISAHFLHRLLGLSRVSVGTGRGQNGLRLNSLRADDAIRLRRELLDRRPHPEPDAEAPEAEPPRPPAEELSRLNPRWIGYAPFTLSGLVSLAAIAAFAQRTTSESGIKLENIGVVHDSADALGGSPLWLAGIASAVIFLLLVAIVSTIGYVLAFWNFRLTREDEALHVSRGLLTTRTTTIEERRLRGVELAEPLLLRVVGGARAVAIATGLRLGRGGERVGAGVLMPPGPREEAERVALDVLGRSEPLRTALTPHPIAARQRRIVRAGLGWILAALVVLLLYEIGLPAWTVLVVALSSPLALLLAVDRYHSLGHAVVAGALVVRKGSLIRRRAMLSTEGVIGWNLKRSFTQRRAGVATLVATTAAGRQRYELQDVEPDEAVRVAEEAVPGLLTPFLRRPPA
jgi:putative membrane protein